MNFCRFSRLAVNVFVSGLFALQIGCGGSVSSSSSNPSTPTATPQFSVSSLSLTQFSGAGSASQPITLTNTGNAALTISGITITGTNASSFGQTNNCGSSVVAGANCSITVTFTPATAGSYSATLTLADNASGSPQTVALNGTGTAPGLSLSAPSLSFTSSGGAAQSVTLTNTGNAALTINGITLTGTNASSFSDSTTCGSALAATSTCSITVNFAASTSGSYSAAINIADNASGSPQSITLSGSASAPTLALGLGANSVAYGQNVTVTATATNWSTPSTGSVTFYGGNTGAVPVAVVSISNNVASFSYTPTVSGTISVSAVLTSGASSVTSQTLPLTVTPSALTSNFNSSTAWTMSNGIISLTYSPTKNAITQLSALVNGVSQNVINNSVILPNIGHGNSAPEIYPLFGGTGISADSSAFSSYVVGSNYIDFWTEQPVDASNTADLQNHWVLVAGYPGLILYAVVTHSSTAGPLNSFGDSFIFLPSDLNFTSLYYTNYSYTSQGQFSAHFPGYADEYAAGQIGNAGCNPICSGRNIGKETVEYTGLASIADLYENYIMASGVSGTINRPSITKYDYAAAGEFHQPHGYITTGGLGEWIIYPTLETHSGGPNQVDLLGVSVGPGMMSLGWDSNHLGGASYYAPQGVNSSRFFGPFLYYLDGTASPTPQTIASESILQADAAATVTPLLPTFANDTTMVNAGYIPLNSTTQRGNVSITVANPAGWSSTPYVNVAILSDPNTNFMVSNVGYQYWSYINSSGQASFQNVRPGSYRLSIYVRGQFGELRDDNVTVTAGATTTINNLTFTPENFGSAAPIWTIGTPDRSAHEFQYGNIPGGGPDGNQFMASYDYWGNLASSPVPGAVVYYATTDGSNPATNSLANFPFNFWQIFDPNLYAGLFNVNDQTVDGYTDQVATSAPYVGNPATYTSPSWQIHFTTTAAQLAQGSNVELTVGLVAQQSDLFASLNGNNQLIWHENNPATVTAGDDPMQRSGVTAYYTWAVFEFPVSQLAAAGQDNVLSLSVNSAWGNTWDALRLEITPTSSKPSVTGWNDYTYVPKSGSQVSYNDAVPNN